MSADALLRWMVDGTLAVTVATALVLALRIPLRRVFGLQVAYAVWALVPLALLVAMLPRPGSSSIAPDFLAMHPGVLVAGALETPVTGTHFGLPHVLVGIWLLGILISALWFGGQQRRFVARLGPLRRDGTGAWRGEAVPSPAVVGALRPRIVLPVDFEARFGRDDAALVMAHEQAHVARGDTRANLAAVALCCLQWFNPLVHLASRRFRLDQELACDATVVARHPHARRRYAGAMLNAAGRPWTAGRLPLAVQPIPEGANPHVEAIPTGRPPASSRRPGGLRSPVGVQLCGLGVAPGRNRRGTGPCRAGSRPRRGQGGKSGSWIPAACATALPGRGHGIRAERKGGHAHPCRRRRQRAGRGG